MNDIKVTHNGVTIEGSRKEVIVALRAENMLMSKIAELVGCTTSYVSLVLNQANKGGRLDTAGNIEQISDNELATIPVPDLAKQYNVPIRVIAQRKKQKGIRIAKPLPGDKRLNQLCVSLFGPSYKPGPRFKEIITRLNGSAFPEKYRKELERFYLNCEGGDTQRLKALRYQARQKLQEQVLKTNGMKQILIPKFIKHIEE